MTAQIWLNHNQENRKKDRLVVNRDLVCSLLIPVLLPHRYDASVAQWELRSQHLEGVRTAITRHGSRSLCLLRLSCVERKSRLEVVVSISAVAAARSHLSPPHPSLPRIASCGAAPACVAAP